MKEQNIIERVRRFVERECKKPTSNYGYEPYIFHFVPMRNYAVALAEKLDADLEIVELAAWLHDIGSIINGRRDHHITGADIAVKKLRDFGYPKKRIERVEYCILNHRGSQNMIPKTLEAKIISDADTIDQFNNISGIFKAALVYEKLDQGQARKSVREKLQRKWKKLYLEESKRIVKPKYKAAMILLK